MSVNFVDRKRDHDIYDRSRAGEEMSKKKEFTTQVEMTRRKELQHRQG